MTSDVSPRMIAVVPTIDVGNLRRAVPWLSMLLQRGVIPVVAANSVATTAEALPAGFLRSSDGTNGGFARSVNRGARDGGDWDWVVLLNDDLELTEDAVAAMVAAIRAGRSDQPELLMFDPEPPRKIPSSGQALLGLSLLYLIPGRLRSSPVPADTNGGPLPSGMFKSFSAVAINRASWERIGTLSESFLFCYEDVEYQRRVAARHGSVLSVPLTIEHNRSKSTKSRIRLVLPAIAASATAYAESNGVPGPVARALAVVTLLIRIPFVFVSSAPWGEHLRGIATGIRLAISGAPAALPPFDPSGGADGPPGHERARPFRPGRQLRRSRNNS